MTPPAEGVAQSEQNARDAHQFGALCLRRCVFNALQQRQENEYETEHQDYDDDADDDARKDDDDDDNYNC